MARRDTLRVRDRPAKLTAGDSPKVVSHVWVGSIVPVAVISSGALASWSTMRRGGTVPFGRRDGHVELGVLGGFVASDRLHGVFPP